MSTEALSGALKQSHSHVMQDRKAAEEMLAVLQKQPDYVPVTFSLLGSTSREDVKLAAAILFKNYIKRNWFDKDNALGDPRHLISAEVRAGVKQHLVGLMLSSPVKVRAQLSNALSVVCEHDFYQQWPELLPELISHLASQDLNKITGVLETADAIFRRYRTAHRSDELWTEIKYVLSQFLTPLLQVFTMLVDGIPASTGNATQLASIFLSVRLASDIFLSLSTQDIPEAIEDSLRNWMDRFMLLLKFDTNALKPANSDDPGLVDEVNAIICEILSLYSEKYEEEFKAFVRPFVEQVWQLLTTLNELQRFDAVVIKAMSFLTSVVRKTWNKSMFEDPAILKGICDRVVIPNIKLREIDVELFEFNGLEYVRQDMEGSDNHTRRRSACDLVRGLTLLFEKEVTDLLIAYVMNLMQEYAKNPAENWWHKDTSMFLVLALTVEGSTSKLGATRVNQFVNVMDFFTSYVLPELSEANVNNCPVLKADCIKFVSTFRSQLPPATLHQVMPLLMNHLACESFVVHTYAAVAIEGLLSLRDPSTRVPVFTRDALKPHLSSMITCLFAALKHEDSSENHYILQALLQVCVTAEADAAEFVAPLLEALTAILFRVAENAKNPLFNHNVFEIIVVLINSICASSPGSVESFEQVLFPPLQQMLGDDACMLEFGPYVFQVLSQLLAIHAQVSQTYSGMFPVLLAPSYWEYKGNVHGLIELICVYLSKPGFAESLVQSSQLSNLLGLFQKLIASMENDVYGMQLLSTITQYFPWTALAPFFPEILKLLFSRVQRSMTSKFGNGFVKFMCFFVSIHNAELLVQTMDTIQPGIFAMVLEKIWLPHCKFPNASDRALVITGMSKLAFSPVMLQEPCSRFFVAFVEKLVELLEVTSASDDRTERENHLSELQMTAGFSNVYSKLKYAKKADPGAGIKNGGKQSFSEGLKQLQMSSPGAVKQLTGALAPNYVKVLEKYFTMQ